jgi:hypothetical protein
MYGYDHDYERQCALEDREDFDDRDVEEDEDEDQDEPVDQDRDDDDRSDFADPGGRSALRAATRSNPRNLPCPNCGAENR